MVLKIFMMTMTMCETPLDLYTLKIQNDTLGIGENSDIVMIKINAKTGFCKLTTANHS